MQVIAGKYLPTKPFSVFQWAVLITMLHYWQAPDWVWSIACTLFGIVTVVTWVLAFTETPVSPGEIVKR